MLKCCWTRFLPNGSRVEEAKEECPERDHYRSINCLNLIMPPEWADVLPWNKAYQNTRKPTPGAVAVGLSS